MAGEKSLMEKNLETIIDTFHHYSVRVGHPDTLNKKEFKDLIKKELPNFLKKVKKDDAEISHMMEDLDTNQDKQLSFEEFIIMIVRLIYASHEKMHEGQHGPGHSHGPGLGESGSGHDGHGHSHGHGHGHSHNH
ncbi:protein S100-A9 [Carlito syrichta]|uniref:Protein S100 n=1 Tax=Carlito syrichta TaxID=1868482 RepID=A0A1U7TW83_CARSF|nr:protein S100-A9 [Carlito syrichta]